MSQEYFMDINPNTDKIKMYKEQWHDGKVCFNTDTLLDFKK
jgi:hypothetical protein